MSLKKPFELRTTNQALSQDELAKFEDYDPPGSYSTPFHNFFK